METNNNRRIAKNSLLLYVRMFITMAIGLYTSRIVLNTLGVSDYGLYNVVGGIITMLSFLNSGMVASSQRYISYELGKNNITHLRKVFCTSVSIHITIALIILLLSETVGLWFINTRLNIDPDRIVAANWVYQCSVITFLINVISVPYNSCIVAHEKMSVFAYISILDVLLKLIIVYFLWISPFDKLIFYSVLLLLISVIIRSCYTVYCKRNFDECSYHWTINKSLFKEMFSFAGWSMLGCMGFSFRDQLSNILLNVFYGTTLNAARGVGMQVSNVVSSFAANFSMALNPQITKQYAAGNIVESQRLVYAGSRFTFYLLTLISIPVIINVDCILELWLGIVPDFTSYFLILSLIASLLYSVSGSVTVALQATGKIKVFQIGISILMLSELPFAYLLLKLNYPPYSVMYPTLFSYTIAIFFRFYLLKHLVSNYSFRYYILKVLLPCFFIFVISCFICQQIKFLFDISFLSLIYSSLIFVIIIVFIVYFVGLNASERSFIKCKTLNLFNKLRVL